MGLRAISKWCPDRLARRHVRFVVVILYTAFVAGRVAKSADDHPAAPKAQTPNARYPKTIHFYAALNGLLLILGCAVLWYLAARSSSNGIPPNTSLGFRDQHTLASAQGWYAAQRVGFHLTAVVDTVITAVALAIAAVAYVRRFHPIWILIIPAIGGLAIAVCFMIAGHYADQAAILVATTVG
jgi:hypothetical protein